MEENIEMKDISKQEEISNDQGETSFTEYNDYNLFLNNMEDLELKGRMQRFLGDIDSFDEDEEKIPKIKSAFSKSINEALWDQNQLDLDYWDGNIILDERAKFDYEQKVNNINIALAEYDIHIDPKDLRIREFLDINILNTYTEGGKDKKEEKKKINGYSYLGEKIIGAEKKIKGIATSFRLYYEQKPALCQQFLDAIKGETSKTAKAQISNLSFLEGESVKDCAKELIQEFRYKQDELIQNARNDEEMRKALDDVNFLENEIKNIKKNKPFKDKFKLFLRTLSYKFTKLLRKIWKNKKLVGGILGTLVLSSIGVLLNQLGAINIGRHLKNAANSIKQYANDVHDMGKRIIHTIQSLYRIPGTIMGFGLMALGIFMRILYYLSYFAGGASASWAFGTLGAVTEIALYLDTNIETINIEVANFTEETGNIIENAGIRSQKYIIKNSPKWVWGKPSSEKTILQTLESGATKAIYKLAEGTEETGKIIHYSADVMRESYYYVKIAFILLFTTLTLIIIRDLSNLTIIKNGNKSSKSTSKRGKKT